MALDIDAQHCAACRNRRDEPLGVGEVHLEAGIGNRPGDARLAMAPDGKGPGFGRCGQQARDEPAQEGMRRDEDSAITIEIEPFRPPSLLRVENGKRRLPLRPSNRTWLRRPEMDVGGFAHASDPLAIATTANTTRRGFQAIFEETIQDPARAGKHALADAPAPAAIRRYSLDSRAAA